MTTTDEVRPEPVSTVASRLAWLDRLKIGLTAGVIVAHCAITYGADGSWFYREPTRYTAVQFIVDVPLAVGALFAMGAFFYIAGCLVPASLGRKGPRRFGLDRVVRLGVPTIGFIVLIVPATIWLVHRVAGPSAESVGQVMRDQVRDLDTGPLWFVAMLLLFSAAVAGVRLDRWRLPGLTPRVLVGWAVGIAVASFVLRLRFAIDTYQIGAAHVWQWGQCAGLFLLGVLTGERGLAPVRRGVAVGGRWVLGAGIVAVVAVLAGFSDNLDPFGGGPHWQSAVLAVIEGAVSVAATVTVLDLFQRWFAHRPAPRLAGAAYLAYVLQVPVIVLASLALRAVPVDGAVKLLVVAPVSVGVCFGLAALLRRARVVRRFL